MSERGATDAIEESTQKSAQDYREVRKKVGLELLDRCGDLIQLRHDLCRELEERLKKLKESDKSLPQVCKLCGSGVFRPQFESAFLGYCHKIHQVRKTLERHLLQYEITKLLEVFLADVMRVIWDIFLPRIDDAATRARLIKVSSDQVRAVYEKKVREVILSKNSS